MPSFLSVHAPRTSAAMLEGQGGSENGLGFGLEVAVGLAFEMEMGDGEEGLLG